MRPNLGELSVRHDREHEVPVLRLCGDIDLATRDTVEAALSVRLRRGPELLVVDLNEVAFVGSCGLVLLAEARERARAAGGRLLVACRVPAVLRAMEVTGLLTVIAPYPTVSDALASAIQIPAPRVP
ncbi:anti-sigma factor antagonist [Actinokineospora sp. NBRC 105648]|uniref:anti-sigma factor antagonist n=1 Tax=Actinokineospora sp. NBRC 105648 TaxID=3032206 RepID=UPI0024A5775B|nr:anti-sigma factor antagonist [Actinokineospora sp. NBRC 105648]GLZ41865.1 hypothetical protein Acsp05_54890 [Actinokineospora sp. NBRC 105648]